MAGRTRTKRGAGPGELAMYRVLASLAPACNDRFTALLLPTAITIDPARGLLVLPTTTARTLAPAGAKPTAVHCSTPAWPPPSRQSCRTWHASTSAA
ncbi:MAG TPA: hypothetical protein VGD83_30100 [Streptosporangiaceae bacterium]